MASTRTSPALIGLILVPLALLRGTSAALTIQLVSHCGAFAAGGRSDLA
jgi:hypothetical protein